MRFLPRRSLPHDHPEWVADGSIFFITIHCAARGHEQLTYHVAGKTLLEAAAHDHNHERWHARLFLLMPDHLHALLAFPQVESMRAVVSDWKRYTARRAGIAWQTDFFDHRLRAGESLNLKADYLRENPVRKGLVAKPENWPWVFEA